MKIAFVYPAFENLGIEYLSAVLKEKGYDTYLLFDPQLFEDLFLNVKFLGKIFSYRKEIINRIKEDKPDVVAFSVVSDNFGWACSYADEIKRQNPNISIVFGGPHVTAAARNVLSNWFIDFIVVGEGEFPMLELVQALDKGECYESIANLGYKKNGELIINDPRPLMQDLDKLPFPDTDLFLNANPYARKEYNIITSRGCVNKCSYCHNSTERRILWNKCGRFLRRRSIESVIAELKERKQKYSFNTLCIWDEVFTYDEKWLEEFCEIYKREINVPFWTFVHPKHITEKTVKLLEKMGCWEVEMGVQTLNQDVKDNILHRYETKEDVISAIKLFKNSKIRLVVDVIFGLPQLKADDYIELIETFNHYRPTKVQTFWLRFYPGTDIIPIAKEKELLTDNEIKEINEGIPSRAAASGGSKVYKEFQKYQTILTLLPYMSQKRISRFVMNFRANKNIKVPAISSWGHLFTRLFDLKNRNDLGGRRYKGRMIYFIIRKIFHRGSKNEN
ncbi:MAG: B12-binding domain-containing radical SAM protein [Clostridiales bacterium]|nr:B12-binding domain-containing radical SAM protein [Clostridiales bacterium]